MTEPGDDAPWLWIISGPNGSGKTTLAKEFMPDIAETSIFLNADDEARSINRQDPASAAITAGRRVLLKISELINAKKSFAIETTFSGISHIRTLERARIAGYQIGLVYVWIGSAELAIRRVGERVRRGGHWVPDEDISRRFGRGLRNLPKYLKLADQAALYDNVDASPFLVAICDGAEWSIERSQQFEQIMHVIDEVK